MWFWNKKAGESETGQCFTQGFTTDANTSGLRGLGLYVTESDSTL